MRDQEGQDRHLAGLMFAFENLTQVQGHFERSEATFPLLKVRWHFNH